VRRGVPPVAVVTTLKAGARSPDAIGPLPCPGRVRRKRPRSGRGSGNSLRLVPGVTGREQDRHRRAVPVDGSRDVPGVPRHGGVRGRPPDGEGLVPVTPFPGFPQCAGAPGRGRSRPTPVVYSPGAQLSRDRVDHQTVIPPPRAPVGAPGAAAARPAPGAVGRHVMTCPSSRGHHTHTADLQERVRGRAPGRKRTNSPYEPSDRGGEDLRTRSGTGVPLRGKLRPAERRRGEPVDDRLRPGRGAWTRRSCSA
jgi:hypothetical protein